MRTALTQNPPQSLNSQSVQCCWQVDVRVSRDDHVVFTQCASGTIDCLSGGTFAGDQQDLTGVVAGLAESQRDVTRAADHRDGRMRGATLAQVQPGSPDGGPPIPL